MRICVVTATFSKGWGYLENALAEQLAGMGHAVRLLTAGRTTGEPQRLEAPGASYELQALAAWQLPRNVYRSREVAPAVRHFGAELTFWLGPGRYFGMDMLKDRQLDSMPVVAFFGENLGMHEFDWSKPGLSLRQRLHALAHRLRGPAVRASCRRSLLVYCYTPQTRPIVLGHFRKQAERAGIDRKMVNIPLGFDPRTYYFDPELRARVRKELGLAPEDIVVCMSSRFVRGPKARELECNISGLQAALQRTGRRALVVGLTDNQTSRYFRRRIAEGPAADRFLCHPFADQKRLNELYNAGDIALFANASISCQAALGTGLVGCLADNGTMNHLITLPDQVFFFRPADEKDLAEKAVAAANMFDSLSCQQREEFRTKLAHGSRWLGYDRILASIWEQVNERLGDDELDSSGSQR